MSVGLLAGFPAGCECASERLVADMKCLVGLLKKSACAVQNAAVENQTRRPLAYFASNLLSICEIDSHITLPMQVFFYIILAFISFNTLLNKSSFDTLKMMCICSIMTGRISPKHVHSHPYIRSKRFVISKIFASVTIFL